MPRSSDLETTTCPAPGCSLPAEVLDEHAFEDSAGDPVLLQRTQCLDRHILDRILDPGK